jgi:hypothetical protein
MAAADADKQRLYSLTGQMLSATVEQNEASSGFARSRQTN